MSAASLIAVLGPMLPMLIKGVEKLFPPKTGSTKMEVVKTAVTKISEELARGGNISALPDDQAITTAIEAVLASLNSSPTNKMTDAVTAGTAQSLNISVDMNRLAAVLNSLGIKLS